VGLRVVFFGTPAFAETVLAGLLRSPHEVAAVVTAPDAPAGRGRRLSSPPAAALARERGLRLLQPAALRDEAVLEELRKLRADAFAVASYGLILPAKVLAIPRLGAFNAHASLLPALRGAAPIERAILAGLEETGVSIQRMTARVDAGDVLASERTPIRASEDAGSLSARLAEIASRLLPATLSEVEAGRAVGVRQDESAATYAPPIEPRERALRWTETADSAARRVRAMSPERIAYCRLAPRGAAAPRRLGVLEASVAASEPTGAEPGTILAAPEREGLVVACAQGALALVTVRPEGGRTMNARDFLRGSRLEPGMRLLDGG